MFLSEPQRTNYDLNFVLFGIPVRIHPFFWLVALVLGARSDTPPIQVLSWVVALFISILLHEFGHAFMALAHGWPAKITLHGFGGLASHKPTYHTTKSSLLISFAGPGAGLLLGGLILLILQLTGHFHGFDPDNLLGFWQDIRPFDNDNANNFIQDMLYINIFWSLINLFPVYPLDGGQIARELFVHFNHPTNGVILSLKLSIITAIGLAAFAAFKETYLIAFLFGYLAYSSFQTLQRYTGRGGGNANPW